MLDRWDDEKESNASASMYVLIVILRNTNSHRRLNFFSRNGQFPSCFSCDYCHQCNSKMVTNTDFVAIFSSQDTGPISNAHLLFCVIIFHNIE